MLLVFFFFIQGYAIRERSLRSLPDTQTHKHTHTHLDRASSTIGSGAIPVECPKQPHPRHCPATFLLQRWTHHCLPHPQMLTTSPVTSQLLNLPQRSPACNPATPATPTTPEIPATLLFLLSCCRPPQTLKLLHLHPQLQQLL